VIAIRVHSDIYDGGLTGPEKVMRLSCPAIPGSEEIPLAGKWLYVVEANYGKVSLPPQPPGPGNLQSPTGLFNGMIAPLGSFPIRGVIWYQGEANVDRASEYRELFPALIRAWRTHWGMENLPFHFVQLANFKDVEEFPGESSWAELREAQALALQLPNTGMAVAIDVGDALDIHPRNKQTVGHRLATSALYGVYGRKEIVPCGPLFRELLPEGGAIRIAFDFTDPGLVCHGEALEGFAIAGADEAFVRASAQIEGTTVLVICPLWLGR
jgi:sialate O-acetylesterase